MAAVRKVDLQYVPEHLRTHLRPSESLRGGEGACVAAEQQGTGVACLLCGACAGLMGQWGRAGPKRAMIWI